MDLYQIFGVCLPKEDLGLISFLGVSDNTCCHGKALNTFDLKILNLKRGTIKPMLPQLHIFTKFAEHIYNCEHMSVMVLIFKNNIAAIADLLENHIVFTHGVQMGDGWAAGNSLSGLYLRNRKV